MYILIDIYTQKRFRKKISFETLSEAEFYLDNKVSIEQSWNLEIINKLNQ